MNLNKKQKWGIRAIILAILAYILGHDPKGN